MISLKVIKPHIISYVVANSYLDSKTYVSFKLKKKRFLTAIHYTNLITSNGGLLNLSPNSWINLNADRETGLSTKETPLFLCIESPMKHGLMGLVVIWWDCVLPTWCEQEWHIPCWDREVTMIIFGSWLSPSHLDSGKWNHGEGTS